MTFEEYLIEKKIDAKKFKRSESELFDSFEKLFLQIHPNSFTAQKLFLINDLRRRFTLKAVEESSVRKAQMKPKIKPKPKQE